MSSIRNLSTEEIRKHYTYDSEDKQHYESWGFEFDRWLNEVKREVWDEAVNQVIATVQCDSEDVTWVNKNPYRQG